MNPLVWFGFIALILFFLAVDLGVFNRNPHVVSAKEALGWTAIWVSVSLLFNVAVYFMYEHHIFGLGTGEHALDGANAALQFFTGYIVEESLSLDNIFVIVMIFQYFKVPGKYQHRVLFWGILGALVMRGTMIGVGLVLIRNLSWITYVFGALLMVSAVRMLTMREDHLEPEHTAAVRFLRRFVPITREYHGSKFFVHENGRRAATPLCVALMVVESTDILFAVDSIPAVFAVTQDPFLVFTSNVFAILGLRSLYFALAAVIDKFRHLKTSLVFVLVFVGAKMILAHHYPIPTFASLAVILSLLAIGVAASLISKGHPSDE